MSWTDTAPEAVGTEELEGEKLEDVEIKEGTEELEGDTAPEAVGTEGLEGENPEMDLSKHIELEFCKIQSLPNTFIWDLQPNEQGVFTLAKKLCKQFVCIKFGITQTPFWRMFGYGTHKNAAHSSDWARMFIAFAGSGDQCGEIEYNLINSGLWRVDWGDKCRNIREGKEQSHFRFMFVYILANTVSELNSFALQNHQKRKRRRVV